MQDAVNGWIWVDLWIWREVGGERGREGGGRRIYLVK